jgi:uncharacterized membrane protein YeaQ/YmgE (transglycosylase-associated protein family)
MNIVSLIIEAISGAVGGNVAGAAMKDNSLGTMGNSIAGIVGGGLGGTLDGNRMSMLDPCTAPKLRQTSKENPKTQ